VLKATTSAVVGVTAAVGSALCCAGPIVAVLIGVSGAGLSTTFEPLRPYSLGGTTAFLTLGFVLVDREERNACEPGRACANPEVRRRTKIVLWTAAAVAVLLATYPRWQTLVL
jgi:mercuric ion transport protein